MTYILHDSDRLLRLANKLIFGLLNLCACLVAQVIVHGIFLGGLAGQGESRAFGRGLCRIEAQARIFNCLASTCGKLDVCVQRGTPPSEEPALDLCVLGQSRLANLFAGNGVLFEGSGQRVFARICLLRREHVRGVKGSTGHGMAERLGLGLCRGRGSEGSLGLGGRRGAGEQVNFFRNGAAEVVEGLANVGRVVVGFVCVLGARRSERAPRRARVKVCHT